MFVFTLRYADAANEAETVVFYDNG